MNYPHLVETKPVNFALLLDTAALAIDQMRTSLFIMAAMTTRNPAEWNDALSACIELHESIEALREVV